jgi:4-amino-4-deoxy-L-arabinose transferase-like glycosyltransferase
VTTTTDSSATAARGTMRGGAGAGAPPPGVIPRSHLVVLLAVVLVGLARGAFWVAVTEVFNPVDEVAHYDYVESMARRHRPPVVGRDRVSPDALGLLKDSSTSWWRPAPVSVSPSDPRWGAVRESYEGVQGPVYYALMVVPFWLSRRFGVVESVYALRLATVLLSLAAVPSAYALARELFPRRPHVWLAAPVLLVVVQGFNANLGSITNDALVVPLAGAALVPAARALRRGLTYPRALTAGALVGLSVATKSNTVALVPMVGLAALAATLLWGSSWSRLVRWGLVAGGAACFVAAPWVLWNLLTYGAPSAAGEVDLVTGPLQRRVPLGTEGVVYHLVQSTVGFWDFQMRATPLSAYPVLWSAVALAGMVAAVATALRRRHRREAASLGWLAAAYPITLLAMLAVIYGVFSGVSSTVGRHMYPALVPVVVGVAASAFVVAGRRGGWLALLAVATVALAVEVRGVHHYLLGTYTDGVIAGMIPVVDQSWGDELVVGPVVTLSPPCAARAFALGFAAEPPPTVPVVLGGKRLDAGLIGQQRSPVLTSIAVYGLPEPTSSAFEVLVPPVDVSVSDQDRDPHVGLAAGGGDPVARIYCPAEDPRGARFAQIFDPQHPSWSYHQVRAWPVAWASAPALVLVDVLVRRLLTARDRRRRRRRPPARTGSSP